ncbi:MAG: hypothetical protein R2867_19665 [Caldilineaceae bacterium]
MAVIVVALAVTGVDVTGAGVPIGASLTGIDSVATWVGNRSW